MQCRLTGTVAIVCGTFLASFPMLSHLILTLNVTRVLTASGSGGRAQLATMPEAYLWTCLMLGATMIGAGLWIEVTFRRSDRPTPRPDNLSDPSAR